MAPDTALETTPGIISREKARQAAWERAVAEIEEKRLALEPERARIAAKTSAQYHQNRVGTELANRLTDLAGKIGERIYYHGFMRSTDAATPSLESIDTAAPTLYLLGEVTINGFKKELRHLLAIDPTIETGISYEDQPRVYQVGRIHLLEPSSFIRKRNGRTWETEVKERRADIVHTVLAEHRRSVRIALEPWDEEKRIKYWDIIYDVLLAYWEKEKIRFEPVSTLGDDTAMKMVRRHPLISDIEALDTRIRS